MGRTKKAKYPELFLALDFGGSGLKSIYQLRNNKPKVLYMEPEVIEVSKASLSKNTKNLLHSVDPENIAWVGIESKEDYQAVGYFATAQYDAINRLKPKKHSLAVYRTLAAIWVIQQKLKLPSKITIALSVLLPPSELSDANMMINNIKKALLSYETPTGELNVTTTDLNCYPEGMGVYLLHSMNCKNLVKNKVLLLVMIGYRNSSILISQRGIPTKIESTELGMIKYLELVIAKTSGLKASQIIEAITIAEKEKKLTGSKELEAIDLLSLTESNLSIDVRKQQAIEILEVINNLRAEYIKRIEQWLSEIKLKDPRRGFVLWRNSR